MILEGRHSDFLCILNETLAFCTFRMTCQTLSYVGCNLSHLTECSNTCKCLQSHLWSCKMHSKIIARYPVNQSVQKHWCVWWVDERRWGPGVGVHVGDKRSRNTGN